MPVKIRQMHPIPYWRLSGFYFFHFAFIGAFAPYWGLYLKSLSFSAFQIGVLMSLLHVTRIFAPAAWGWLADHTGKRVIIVQVAAVTGLISYCGVFFGESFAWLFIIMALMSFFWSASLPLIEATTLSYLGEGTAQYGRIRVWGSVGFICAVTGIGYMLDALDIASLLWAVLGFKLGIVIFSRQIPEAVIMVHSSKMCLSGRFRAPGGTGLFRGLHADGARAWALLHFLLDLPGRARLQQERRRLAMGHRRYLRNWCVFPDAAAHAPLSPQTSDGFQFRLRGSAFPDDRLGRGIAARSAGSANLHAATYGAHHATAMLLVHHYSVAVTRRKAKRFTPALRSGSAAHWVGCSAVMPGNGWGRDSRLP